MNYFVNRLFSGWPMRVIILTAFITLTIFMIGSSRALAASITSLTSGNWSATAWPDTTRTGTINSSSSSSTVTGSGTAFLSQISTGNIIKTSGGIAIGTVSSIQTNTSLTLTTNATSTNTGIAFKSQGVGSGDTVTIAAGSTLTLDVNSTITSLSFTGGATASPLTHSGSNSLTVTGNVTLNQPTSAITQTWNIAGGSATVNGQIIFAGTTTGNIKRITVGAGTLNANGGISFPTGGVAATNLLNLSGAAGTINLKGSVTNPTLGTLTGGNSGSIFNYADTTNAQTVYMSSTWTYYNLYINNTSASGATLGALVSATRVPGDLRVQSGTLNNGGFSIAGAGGKTFEVANGATLKLTGTSAMPTSFTLSLGATSTVDFAGTGAQTVAAANYGNLTISGARTTTNNVTLFNGGTIGIAGTFNPLATFGTGGYVTTGNTVSFNGSTAQTIPAFTFNSLTINNASGPSLGSSITVNATLTFTAGKLFTGANTLFLATSATAISGADASKYVAGNLLKVFNLGTGLSFKFEVGDNNNYTPVALSGLNVTSNGSTISANTTATQQLNITTNTSIDYVKDVNRYWTLAASAGIGTCNATFSFPSSDEIGGANYTTFIAGRYSSGWTYPTVGSRTTVGSQRSISVNTISPSGDFVLGEPQPAPPTLSVGTANVGAGMATLVLQSTATGTGYFTLLPGLNNQNCGSGIQIKLGQDSGNNPAPRYGSLPITANTPGNYTVRNLNASDYYTICFTADYHGMQLQQTAEKANLNTDAIATFVNPVWSSVGDPGLTVRTSNYGVEPPFTGSTYNYAVEPHLAFAPDGTPHSIFSVWTLISESSMSVRGNVIKYSNDSWIPVGSAMAGTLSPPALAFAPNGTPYVAYSDDNNSYYSTVSSYTANSWNIVGDSGFSADRVDWMNIDFVPDGNPCVTYRPYTGGIAPSVICYTNGNWNSIGTPDGGGRYPSMAIAPDGTIYVAYQNSWNGYKAKVMKYSSGVWSLVGNADFSYGRAYEISVVIAPDGTPYVLYYDVDNSNLVTVKKYLAGNWSDVGSPGLYISARYSATLAIAPDGMPYVVVSDPRYSNKLTAMKYSSSQWSTVGTPGFASGSAINIAFSPDGTPYLAFMISDKPAVMKIVSSTSITSVSRQTPSTAPTNTSSATFRATFADPVSGVISSNFDLSPTVTGASITGVTPVGATPATQWDITVNTGSGDGDLGVRLANATGIYPVITTTLPFTDQSYTIDKTAPAISSFTAQTTVTSVQLAWSVTDAGSGISGYKLLSGTAPPPDCSGTALYSGSGSGFTDTNLTPGQTYYYLLCATDNVGNAGTSSASASIAPRPTLSTPTFNNVGAGMVTLVLQSDVTGTGYFTLLAGLNNPNCGNGDQTMAGTDKDNLPAPRFGSLPLTANTQGNYTLRNLPENTSYTVCFTADNNGVLLQPVIAAANFTTNTMPVFTYPKWIDAGSGTSPSNSISMDFTPDGTMYAEGYYNLYSNNGGTWNSVGTQPSCAHTSGTGYRIAFALAPDGTPYQAFSDVCYSNKISVYRFSGGTWNPVGNRGFTPGWSYNASIAFSPDGTPYIASANDATMNTVTVMKLNAGTWVTLGNPATSSGWLYKAKLVFAPDGIPYLSYYENNGTTSVSVLKYDGGSWNYVGSAVAANQDYSFTIDANGTPYLAFSAGGNGSSIIVMKYSSNTWSQVGDTTLTKSQSGAAVSLAVAPDGAPYVGDDSIKKFSGGNWNTVGTADRSYSLAFAPDGTPHIGSTDVKKLVSAHVPTAITGTATDISATGATLNGEVSDNGLDTATSFYYYNTVTYSPHVTLAATTGGTITAGSGSTQAAVTLSGLNCNTPFNFWVIAANSDATVSGTPQTFTTSACTPQTITFDPISAKAVGDAEFDPGASATSGLPISYISSNPSVAHVYNGKIYIDGVGTTTITAKQLGGGVWGAAAEVAQLLTVNKGNTFTAVTSNLNPSTFEQQVTFTAMVTSGATGTVTFTDGATNLCSNVSLTGNQANCSSSALSIGLHTITATYSGSTNYLGSSGALDQTVNAPSFWQLNVTVTGSGTITSNPQGTDPVGIACTSGTCSTKFTADTPVELFHSDSSGYTFEKWDGDCIESDRCLLTMNGNKNVTATFTLVPKVKNNTTGVPYATLADALSAALTGEEIRLQDTELAGPITLDKPLILKGGWYNTFISLSGLLTTLNGDLIIQSGASTAETIVVKGKLEILGGSLLANGIEVQ